ncbi:peptidase S9 [Marinicauda pacifica]|uniref:Acyl-peptide hydrolase n=1 Tax=Marinicauda pacifica TaxID=1133559 RepID=A0A4S2HEC2_9PROT|nr:S9 family peptidase [Marinicauda pacifica]TGY94356.1 S9 family peptidase [Marinicauda pacifica]GGE35112.1 peptidase S9 [Marinicauda pacifica]
MNFSATTLVLGLAGLALTACDAPGTATGGDNAAATGRDTAEAHSAEVFFNTTSFGMASSSGHAFSSETGQLLISSDETGVFNAFALDPESGTREALTTSTGNAVFAVSWFPADGRALVTMDGGGDELNHVYVRELDGTLTDLTPGDNVKADFAGWTADGTGFWVTSNERDPAAFDVYAYDAGSYERELVFENTDALQPTAISPDGRWLALDRPRTSADSDILLVDLASEDKAPQLITGHEGNIAYSTYTFTPDSEALVYATNEHGEWNQAWRYEIETGEQSPLIEADWDVMYVAYSNSGRYRVSAINADGFTEVTVLDQDTGGELLLPSSVPAGDLASVRFSPSERQIAFLVTSSTAPANVHWVDLNSGEHRQLTEALNPELDPEELVEAEIVRFESFDGLTIPGIMYRPHEASADNPVPALVMVHGGPGGQSRAGYSAMVQHLVDHGYAVYAANNRGSSGYGKTFFHMDDRRHGEEDLQDIVAAGEYLRAQDWVQDDAVGVIGGSYGGYITAAALAFHPEAFDAGINIFGVTNWVRTLESIPPWWEAFREALYDEMGDPATDAERHRAISPLFHADNIVKPLLVVQGANDPRVLQVESDEIVEAVRANGVPVEYIVFEDEGHGFLKRENRIEASNAYVDFLDTHLRGEAGMDAAPSE